MDLAQLRFLFLDGQTTGLSPRHAEMIELGWSLSFSEDRIETRLLRPAEPSAIPPTVWRMTGLTPEELDRGEQAEAVWRELVESAGDRVALVIHYSQFELPFLRSLHERVYGEGTPLPWPVICTYRVAKRLHGDLPARSLRALSGHFGLVLEETHRARPHVAATQRIWESLLSTLRGREAVATLEGLRAWLETPRPAARRTPHRYLVDRRRRLDIPDSPGIYEMLSAAGAVLYVGKATSLRARVNSYFRQRRTTRKLLKELMTQVADVRVTSTESAVEAALLENDRIKAIDPPYNLSLRSGERRLFFTTPKLDGFAEATDDRHSWGPFLSRSAFDSIECLWRLRRFELGPLDEMLLGHPPEEMARALDSLLSSMAAREPASVVDLLALGRRVRPVPDETDEAMASVRRKLRRSVKRLHQARWLCWLMECRVFWPVPGRPGVARRLVIRGGEIAEASFVDEREAKRPFARARVTFRERQRAIDLATYDRMRILGTELALLVKKGVPVVFELSSSRRFDSSTPAGRAWVERALSPERQP